MPDAVAKFVRFFPSRERESECEIECGNSNDLTENVCKRFDTFIFRWFLIVSR